MRPEICVGAVVVDDDRILMIRRGHGPAAGEWSVPGGRLESGETLAEAVVREVLEETAVEVVCEDLIGWVEQITEDHHFVILDFRATVLGGAGEVPRAGDDAAEASWIPMPELAGLRLVDGLAEFLSDHGLLDLFA